MVLTILGFLLRRARCGHQGKGGWRGVSSWYNSSGSSEGLLLHPACWPLHVTPQGQAVSGAPTPPWPPKTTVLAVQLLAMSAPARDNIQENPCGTRSIWKPSARGRWNCRSSEQQTYRAMQHLLPQGPGFTGLTLHVGKVSDSLSNKLRSFSKARGVTWPLVRLGP